MKSFLGVPIRARGEVFGNLYLTDKIGADEFTEEDEALTEALALAAGIAIDNTRLHDRVRTMSVLDDRERIGRDLHDRVVQRLFAVGMALQGAAACPISISCVSGSTRWWTTSTPQSPRSGPRSSSSATAPCPEDSAKLWSGWRTSGPDCRCPS